MRDYEELVKALREHAEYTMQLSMYDDLLQAADAIEELTRENKEISFRAAQLEAMNDALIGETGAADALMVASKPRWIPVTERLPEAMPGNYSLDVLVTDGEDIAICQYFNGDGWCSMWSYSGIGKITHWMPLPSMEGLNET